MTDGTLSHRLVDLFEADNGQLVTEDDFLRALREVGVQPGNSCIVHTDIRTFGRARVKGETILQTLTNVLMEAVTSSGSLVLPTFSYSFCDHEDFDVQETPSKVGVLNEYFRKRPDVRRTAHPIFSFAVWGKTSDELLSVEMDCFGSESLFGKVHRRNGILVFLGVSLEACTFIHYVEQSHGVPYRYNKRFSGSVIDQGNSRPCECNYLVRYLDANVVLSLDRLQAALSANGKLKAACVGDGRILAVKSVDLYRTAWDMLDEDIFSLLREPPRLNGG